MPSTISNNIGRSDFNFENSTVKIIANRSCPEIKLAGLTLGPFEEGNEYEVQYWAVQELEKAGIAHLREEEGFDATRLYKIQWRERVQTAGQISKLPDYFYPKLRRYLKELREEVSKSPEKMRDYEKTNHTAKDILNARLKKIVSLASAPAQTEQMIKNLAEEERVLYEQLYVLIRDWKTQILESDGGEEK
jgi:hypothetical protein